jgi:adenylate kinase
MNIVLLGAPGTGKGTQAQFISERLEVPIISPGDILRQEMKNNTVLGSKAEQYVKGGTLVPDDIIIDMIKERVIGETASGGFILDGFPRNLSQAETLETMLGTMNRSIDRAIYLRVSEERIIERLSGRRVCRDCGETYHIIYNPPKEEGVCDRCGGQLYQRDDDRPEIIRQRPETYNRDTSPIIDYYSKKAYYLQIDADDEIDRIKGKIMQALGG